MLSGLIILYFCINQNITDMTDKIHDSGEDTTTQHAEQCGFKKAHIGQNIAAIRRGRGISQEYVAAKLGKSQQTVSNIELMEDVPEDLLAQIAKILNVSPEYIKNYDLERLITNNTQIINEGGQGDFICNDNSQNSTNTLDVIKYIVSENDRLHVQAINEKDAINKELKAENKLLKAEIKQLREELQQYRIGGSKK